MNEKIVTFSAFMTKEQFAASVGVSAGKVRGWIQRGYLPTIKVGKNRLVNVAQLYADNINVSEFE